MPTPEKILSIRDLAQRYGRTPECVRQWLRSGRLPPPDVLIGKSPGWRPSTLERVERTVVTVGGVSA